MKAVLRAYHRVVSLKTRYDRGGRIRPRSIRRAAETLARRCEVASIPVRNLRLPDVTDVYKNVQGPQPW